MSDGQSASDEAILGEISSMCDLLGLRRLVPQKLVWQDRIYLGRGSSYPLPVDSVIAGRKKVILSTRMQAVLTPEEWKPLIGSSLLTTFRAKPKALRVILGSILITVGIYVLILLLATMTSILGSAASFLNSFAPLYVGLWVVFAAVISLYYDPSPHSAYLKADLQVAAILGTENFLTTLKKIESMGFSDVEKRDTKTSKRKQPSVRERIQNLESRVAAQPQ